MIARMWHGVTSSDKADEYLEFLNRVAIPDYQSVAGNKGVFVLRRADGQTTHFITFTLWDSFDAIREFAGEELTKAKYYPEDKDFLLSFEPTVVHYEAYGRCE